MSDYAPPPAPTVAIVLPPREGFGPRRARRIGLTVREHASAVPEHRAVVLGGRQSGPVFPDLRYYHVHALSFFPGSIRWRYLSSLTLALRKLHPTLIEVHGDALLALGLQRRFPHTRVVLFQHDDPAASPATAAPEARAALFEGVARVVTSSNWLRDRMLDGVPEPMRPPLVLPPAVDIARLPQSGDGDEVVAISKRRTRLVLFAGRLVPEKGPDQFVAACALSLPYMPGWRAEIVGAAEHGVGAAETGFTLRLQATSKPIGIGMMGYRDHPDAMLAMARAAIVAIPTRVPDPSGRVAVEAMANGAAVICARTGALPEIVGDAAVFVDPDKPDDLAAAIRALARDPARRTELARLGRARAAAFDLPEIGRRLRDVRAHVLAGD